MPDLLTVRGLTTRFRLAEGFVHAVNGVDFTVAEGETLAVVGESGCGKSVTALSILRLVLPPGEITAGEIIFEGKDLISARDEEMRKIRGNRIAMIFQEPMTSLNPVYSVGAQIIEAIRIHRDVSRRAARERAVKMLELVGIPSPAERIDAYPHEFSGGMRQRVMIAMALIGKPRILLADEPTTALDVTIQAQVLDLLAGLKDSRGLAIMLITHDLGLVQRRADTVAVMYAGRVVELAPAADLFARPMHPYTRCLLKCRPHAGSFGQRLATVRELMDDPREFQPIDGRVAWWPHREQRAEVSMHPVAESHTVAVWQ